MHVSALNIGRAFFEQYLSRDPEVSVLDVGGMDVNGSLRSVAGAGWRFLSVDLVEGPGVDVVLDDPYRFPFPDEFVRCNRQHLMLRARQLFLADLHRDVPGHQDRRLRLH